MLVSRLQACLAVVERIVVALASRRRLIVASRVNKVDIAFVVQILSDMSIACENSNIAYTELNISMELFIVHFDRNCFSTDNSL